MGIKKSGKKWIVDIRDRNGSRQRKRFERKLDAERYHALKKSDLLSDKYMLPKNVTDVFDELAKKYISEYSRVEKAKQTYLTDISLMKSLLSFFSGVELKQITMEMVDIYRRERLDAPCRKGGTISRTTINHEVGLLRNMLNKAVDWRMIDHNPILRVRMFKERPRERILPKKKLVELIEMAPFPLKEMIILALNTGMRKGEILGLEWDRVDLDEGTITLVKTKTNKVRVIPLNPVVQNVLEVMQRNSLSKVFVFYNPNTDQQIQDMKRSFASLLRQCGIRDFRFHDLRHCFASYAISGGNASLFDLMQVLGHEKIATTSRYVKSMREGAQRLVDSFQIGHYTQEDNSDEVKEFTHIAYSVS